MRRYLLDTHILIWHVYNQKKLSRQIVDEFEDYNNRLFLSRVSLMEIAIKNRDGKLQLEDDFETILQMIDKHWGIEILNIENRHLITLSKLDYPEAHKDPFDHLLISQAITDKICLISADKKMKYYTTQGLELFEN